MPMLSEDGVNLRELSREELERASDLWFDLAQTTNGWDPPYAHVRPLAVERREWDE